MREGISEESFGPWVMVAFLFPQISVPQPHLSLVLLPLWC